MKLTYSVLLTEIMMKSAADWQWLLVALHATAELRESKEIVIEVKNIQFLRP